MEEGDMTLGLEKGVWMQLKANFLFLWVTVLW